MFLRLFGNQGSPKSPRRPRALRRRPRMECELLEQRELLAAFTVGDLIVNRVGDASAALTTNGTATFIDYSNSTTANQAGPVQSMALPRSGAGTLTEGGTFTSEVSLTLSADSHSAVLVGYDAAAGTTTTG